MALLLGLAAACNGGGGSEPSPSPTATGAATATATVSATPSAVASATAEPGVSPSPTVSMTPVPVGIPDDPVAFLSDLGSQSFERKICEVYDAASGLVPCGENGVYAPSPPPQSEDVTCDVLIVEGRPLALACVDPGTSQVVYYVLPE